VIFLTVIYRTQSASGLQGKYPMIIYINVCEGSRQNRSVPSVKGLALMVELYNFLLV